MYAMQNLGKLNHLGELVPDALKSFRALDQAAFKDGSIPVRYKELIAVAVALTTQCPYCINIHADLARKAGATDRDLAEAAMVAAAIRAGGAVTHALHAIGSA